MIAPLSRGRPNERNETGLEKMRGAGTAPFFALGVTGTAVAVLALRVRTLAVGKREAAGSAFADTFRAA